MVVELADQVVAALDGGVAEEGIGGELHGALAVHDAMALVGVAGAFGQIGRVGRGGLFLDLEEERVDAVGAAEAFAVDDVVAQADGAGADDFEGDVLGGVLLEEVAALGLQGARVGTERGKDQGSFAGVETLEQRRVGVELAGGFGVWRPGVDAGGWLR